jgi:hypothetical protein
MRLKFSSKFNIQNSGIQNSGIQNSGQPVFLARTKRRLLRARCSC